MSDEKTMKTEFTVDVEQLRVGVFISLKGVAWLDHPFFFSEFKITKPDQIQALKDSGILRVVCVPEKSDVLPIQQKANQTTESAAPVLAEDARQTSTLWKMKQDRIERNRERRAKAEQCEEQFRVSIESLKIIMRNIEAEPAKSFEAAGVLMSRIVEILMAEKDVSVQLMNTNFGQENIFYHSLNVSVLAMMLGKEYGIDSDSLRVLGLGALFHDIGKNCIPHDITRKKSLSSFERRLLEFHPRYGVDILTSIEHIPTAALDIVLQHHEQCDGHGYPQSLSREQISLMARIVSIVNTYDNHCNKQDYRESLSPYESLATMFSSERDFFDADLLSLFIHCLGIYPPGTIVKLSNGGIGMVMSVDSGCSLQPSLLLYDPDIPKKEALIVSLREEQDLSIEGSIRPSILPEAVYDYLSPRRRVTYYVSESTVDKDHRSTS